MSFLSHLEVLRWHLVRSVVAILIFAVAVFMFNDFVFGDVVFGPTKADFFTFEIFCKSGLFCVEDMPFVLRSAKPMQQFTTHISSSIIIGFIFAFPYVFWEIWGFVKPALYSNEKNPL